MDTLVSKIVVLATLVSFAAAQQGCADGTREGFTDLLRYPKIAACAGDTDGVDVNSTAANSFCATGWHVCTGADINAARNDPDHHTAINTADATSFAGKFAYNANNDCQSCQDTCGARAVGTGHFGGCAVRGGSDPDLACMGSGCTRRGPRPACLADNRFDSGNGGCTIRASSNIRGLVCCRDDYQRATEVGDLETVFAADFQISSNTQYGYAPLYVASDTGISASTTQNGIVCKVSGYSHRRGYGNPTVVPPLLADEILLNRRGSMTAELTHVPPGDYLLTTYHNDQHRYCGGCFPVTVSADGVSQQKFVRTSNAISLSTASKLQFNVTVGADQKITIVGEQTGTQYATSSNCPSCAATTDYQGTCGRCTASNAHLGFNGLNLKAPTVQITSTVTTTTTRSTHTVQQDVNRTLNELYDRQTLLLGRMTSVETDLSSTIRSVSGSEGSLQSQIYDLLAKTDITSEAILGGGDDGYMGLLAAVDAMNQTLMQVRSDLHDEINRNSVLRQKLQMVSLFGVSSSSSLNAPQVKADSTGNVDIRAGSGGSVTVSGSTCDSVDLCDAMAKISAITQALQDAAAST